MKNCRLHTIAALAALFCMTGISVTSCSSDDDMFYNYPESVISLNMMNESNGNTKLADSNVYINNADNFTSTSTSAVIAPLGTNGGFTALPALSQLASEVAVIPGEFYQVFNDKDVRMFASGKRALSVDASYYNLYVASWINDDNGKHIGAKVSYNIESLENTTLPAWNETACTLIHGIGANSSWVEPEDGAVCKFPAGSEINVDYNGWENYITIEVEGNVVTARFTNNRPRESGQAYLYVRDGSFYTRATVNIRFVTYDI